MPDQPHAPTEFGPGQNLAYFIMTRLKPGELIFEDSKSFDEIIQSEEFIKLAPTLLKDFAVSGVYDREKKFVRSHTDLDGKVSLGLLEIAGFDIAKTKYVLPGTTKFGYLNIDTGGYHGVMVEGDVFREKMEKITAWCDNHGEESARGSSSAEFLYTALKELKLIEPNEVLDNLVKFNTHVESGDFDWEKEYPRSYKTIIGLNRFMNFKQLFDFFLSGRQYDEEVTEADFEKWASDEFLNPSLVAHRKAGRPIKTIKDYSEMERANIEKARETLEQLKQDGFRIQTRHGEILINPDGVLQGGYAAAYSSGATGMLLWAPGTNSFVISMQDTELDFQLPQGVLVRRHIYIKAGWDHERLTLSLREILDKLGYAADAPPKLKELIGRDQEEGRGIFQVMPELQQGSYIGYVNQVFSLFPRDWKPLPGAQNVAVRVRDVKQDKKGKAFYILEPLQEKSTTVFSNP